MCGRYSFAPNPKAILALLGDIMLPTEMEQSFNIAPTQTAWVVTNRAPKQLSALAWGLVPQWSKVLKPDGRHINARAEGVLTTPSFEQAMRHRRCLVPADSFYEWRRITDRQKQPYRILRTDGAMLVFAGIWEECPTPSGGTLHTFSIITTAPNTEMAAVHDRMPAILSTKEERDLWLSDATAQEAHALLLPAPSGTLRMYAIDNGVGSVTKNDARLHDEVPKVKTLFD